LVSNIYSPTSGVEVVHVHVRLDGKLAQKIEAEKGRTGLSKASILKLALADYLGRQRPEGDE